MTLSTYAMHLTWRMVLLVYSQPGLCWKCKYYFENIVKIIVPKINKFFNNFFFSYFFLQATFTVIKPWNIWQYFQIQYEYIPPILYVQIITDGAGFSSICMLMCRFGCWCITLHHIYSILIESRVVILQIAFKKLHPKGYAPNI